MNPVCINYYSRGLYRTLLGSALLVLAACNSSSTPSTPSNNETILGDPVLAIADLSNDALIAPAAPELRIEYQDQSLHFLWLAQTDINTISLFSFDTTTQIETLFSDQINSEATSYSVPHNALHTAINNTLYRIELCTPDNCVSSYRTAVTTPLTSTPLSLANSTPDAKWQSYLNRSGNVMVAISNDAQIAEVHFKLGSAWIYASSFNPTGLNGDENSLIDIALSDTGDTVAVAIYQPQTNQIDISVFDRLGEGWFETSQWQTSYIADTQTPPTNLLAMAGDSSALLVLNDNGLARYTRAGFNYSLHSNNTDEATILTWDASADLNELVWLNTSRELGLTLNKLAYSNNAYNRTAIRQGMPSLLGEDAQIEVSTQGDTVLIAGWQTTENRQYSPTLWHAKISDDRIDIVSTHSEVAIGEPSDQLVLGSSDNLQTSLLSWTGDDNLPKAQLYTINEQVITATLSLDETVLLDQQSYQYTLNGDGSMVSWASISVETLAIAQRTP